MKNVFKLMMVLMLLSVALVSCTKDSVTKKSEIVYNSTSYELSKGYLESDGQTSSTSGIYYYVLMLTSKNVTVDIANLQFGGTGNGLIFELFTSSSTDISDGTYNFESTNAINTFDLGLVIMDYDWTTLKKSAIGARITSGTVKVAKSGTNYEVTLDATVTGGSKVTAYYNGTLVKY